jgi:hypothetical protein
MAGLWGRLHHVLEQGQSTETDHCPMDVDGDGHIVALTDPFAARSRTICGRMSSIRSASYGHSSGAVSSKFSILNVAIRTSAI